MRCTSFFRLLLGVMLSGFMLNVQAEDLSQIQQRIKQQQSKINENRQKRNVLQSTLKTQEIEMGKVINKLKEQLDSAYRSGIHPSVLERLMSEPAKDADRMTAYYEHINQVRIDAIYELRRTQAELKARRDEFQGQQKGQQTQLTEQKKQEKDLKKVQNERELTLKSIDKVLEQDENRLDSLKANAESLKQQVANAARESERQEKQDLAALEAKKNKEENRKATEQEKQQVRAGSGLKGGYSMPVSGKVVQSFGNGWTGVVISANAGTPVKAIASGRVIMSDWLQGYGNMVAIDHGNGDISLYGYNQNLSVRKGSRVAAGQTIATVGNSGGQTRSGLYFGITRKGSPVNPMKLVK